MVKQARLPEPLDPRGSEPLRLDDHRATRRAMEALVQRPEQEPVDMVSEAEEEEAPSNPQMKAGVEVEESRLPEPGEAAKAAGLWRRSEPGRLVSASDSLDPASDRAARVFEPLVVAAGSCPALP